MINSEELRRITEDCWRSIVGLDLNQGGEMISMQKDHSVYSGCIRSEGPWEGAFVVLLTKELARRAAGSRTALDVGSDAVSEFVAQLVETLGTKVQEINEGMTLSGPTVVQGTPDSITFPGSRTIKQAVFESEGETLVVIVRQSTTTPKSIVDHVVEPIA